MNRTALLLLAVGLLPLSVQAELEQIELFQRYEVMAQQQRVVGNLRTAAKTDGIVVRVPQLYVYHAELSAAFHLGGFRPGFVRELEMIIESRRGERSMIRLDRLLERTRTPQGDRITIEDLPLADVTLAFYRRLECEECDQVAEVLREWIEAHPERSVLWLDVRTDTPRR
ncbi:MAG: hypothetical protein ACOCVP_01910 [Wenzhouxiangella sp.]